MSAEHFLKPQVIFVFLMGLVAFAFSTAAGILLAKFINIFATEK